MTKMKLVMILQSFVLFLVAVSMITISETTSSSTNNTASDSSSLNQSSISVIPTTTLNVADSINVTTSSLNAPIKTLGYSSIQHESIIPKQSSEVVYENHGSLEEPLISKVVYDEDLADIKRGIQFFVAKKHRNRPSPLDEDEDYEYEEDEDVNMIDNRNNKQVLNIIEMKRPTLSSMNKPPPETIIFNGKRFRLYRPMKNRYRKRIIHHGEPIQDEHRPSEITMNPYRQDGQQKYLIEPISHLYQPPPLPPNRGVPMVAKVYWRRIIYPSSTGSYSATAPRPKRKIVYTSNVIENEDNNNNNYNKPKVFEKYVVYYVKKKKKNSESSNNNNNETLVATTSNTSKRRIHLDAIDTNDDEDNDEEDNDMDDMDSDMMERVKQQYPPKDNDNDNNPAVPVKYFQRPISRWPVWKQLNIPASLPLEAPPPEAPHRYKPERLFLKQKGLLLESDPHPIKHHNHNKNNKKNGKLSKKSSETKKFFKIIQYHIDE